eukprot:8959586-Heterocapsa_arctica.AAC.1
MGIDNHTTGACFKLKIGLSSSDFVQNDKRSAWNRMVIARMPEDRPNTVKTFRNLQTPCAP